MYEFNKEKHHHSFDGKPLMGVTTVLSVISKPMLIQWAANMACDYIKDAQVWKLVPETPPMVMIDRSDLDNLIKEARSAHRKKKEKAGDWGTAVHAAIENWIKFGGLPELEDTQMIAFNDFKEWAEDNKVKFIESEKHVWSEKMWTGGIVDLVFEMEGKKYIGDIKTSSGIYNEAFFQMGAYHLMLEEMGVKDIEGYIVINLKKDGTMDLKRADNMKINQDAFLSALNLYKIINSLK